MSIILRVLALLVAVGIILNSMPAAAEGREWTSKESVSLRYFVTNQEMPHLWGQPGETDIALFSKSREYFLFVFHYGAVKADKNVYELRLYRTADIVAMFSDGSTFHENEIAPYAVLEFGSRSSYEPAISHVQWDEALDRFYFLGMTEEGNRQIFQYEPDNKKLEKLTDHESSIQNFSCRDLGCVFYDKNRFGEQPLAYPMERLSFLPNGDLITPLIKAISINRSDRYVVYKKKIIGPISMPNGTVDISPNGRFGIIGGGLQFSICGLASKVFCLRNNP